MSVKGNLKHRIELLGEEMEDADLNDEQLVLRNIARSAQGFDDLIHRHRFFSSVGRPFFGDLLGEEEHSSIVSRHTPFS